MLFWVEFSAHCSIDSFLSRTPAFQCNIFTIIIKIYSLHIIKINQLILMICRELHSLYIHICTFCVVIFLKLFFCKWYYLIQIIFKWIYLTHKWTLIGTTTLDQSGPGSNGKEGVLYTLHISKTKSSL